MKTKQLIVITAAALAAMVASAYAQGDKDRALPEETTWSWMTRTRFCSHCDGSHNPGAMAFVNWSNDLSRRYDNIEMEPDEVLRTPTPFREPKFGEPHYDSFSENQIRTHDNHHGFIVSRLFRRGIFTGYLHWKPPVLP